MALGIQVAVGQEDHQGKENEGDARRRRLESPLLRVQALRLQDIPLG